MKKITTLLVLVVFCTVLFAQNTYTSVSNGNWTSPTTWSPTGVPTPSDNAIINTDVSLNTDFGNITGVITINTGGSLIEDIAGRSFMINGGGIYVDGTMDVTNFSVLTGIIEVSGSFTASMMYSADSVENYGIINIDSLQNTGFLNNYANATINALAILNEIEIYNAGIIDATNLFNDGDIINDNEIYMINFTNAFWTLNSMYIEFDYFTNTGDFQNDGALFGFFDFTNTGYFEHYGDFDIDNDFLNADSINGEAYFYTESLVTVGNDWYNADTVEGLSTAQFCVINNTGNGGELIGSFDLCDDTPPINPPYIDLNTGNIDINISYCATPCNTSVNNSVLAKPDVNIYPNPFKTNAKIEFKNINFNNNAKLNIFNSLGQKIYTATELKGQNIEISSKELGKGLFLYNITNGKENIYSGKIIVE